MARPEIPRVSRSKQKALAAYDRLSGCYDWLAASSERPYAMIGLHKLNIHAGETVLEVGCGTGTILLAIATAAGSCGQVHGIDLSRGMISVAERKVSQANIWRARVAWNDLGRSHGF